MKNPLLASLVGLAILSLAALSAHAEEISGVSSEYALTVSKEGQLKLQFNWPERFGRKITTVPLSALNLQKADVKPVDGGQMSGTWIVTIPARGNTKSIHVESWHPRIDESFPKKPDTTFQSAELFFHCPTKAAARNVLSALQKSGQ